MAGQAHIIRKWIENVYVNFPIVNSQGKSMLELIWGLYGEDIKLNITAILAESQLESLVKIIANKTPSIKCVLLAGSQMRIGTPFPSWKRQKTVFRNTRSRNSLGQCAGSFKHSTG